MKRTTMIDIDIYATTTNLVSVAIDGIPAVSSTGSMWSPPHILRFSLLPTMIYPELPDLLLSVTRRTPLVDIFRCVTRKQCWHDGLSEAANSVYFAVIGCLLLFGSGEAVQN